MSGDSCSKPHFDLTCLRSLLARIFARVSHRYLVKLDELAGNNESLEGFKVVKK